MRLSVFHGAMFDGRKAETLKVLTDDEALLSATINDATHYSWWLLPDNNTFAVIH